MATGPAPRYVLRVAPPGLDDAAAASVNAARFHRDERLLLVATAAGTAGVYRTDDRRPAWTRAVAQDALLEARWLCSEARPNQVALQTRGGVVCVADVGRDAATPPDTWASVENESHSFARMSHLANGPAPGAGHLVAVPSTSRGDGSASTAAVLDLRAPGINACTATPSEPGAKAGALCSLQLLSNGSAPFLATGHEDGCVRLFDLRAGGSVAAVHAVCRDVLRDADDEAAITTTSESAPRWRLEKSDMARDATTSTPIFALDLPQSGCGVGACGGASERAAVLAVNAAAPADEAVVVRSRIALRAGSGGVNDVAAVRDPASGAALLFFSGWDGRVRVLDASRPRKPRHVCSLRYHERGVASSDCLRSADGTSVSVASAGRDGRVAVWSL